MQYQKIWDKVLSPNEIIKYEFSVGPFYRKLCLILWCLFGAMFLFSGDTAGVGIIIILLAAFYYAFYLKVANAYAFSDDRVLIHKGWLSTKLISTEYQKITNVTVHDPFISRIITKTGTLIIDTAGTSGKEIQLTRIERPYEVKKKLDELRVGR